MANHRQLTARKTVITARKATGGKTPRVPLATKAARRRKDKAGTIRRPRHFKPGKNLISIVSHLSDYMTIKG